MFFTGICSLVGGIVPFARPDGLCGTLFVLLIVGDGGRLGVNAMFVGGTGVLAGRSMGIMKLRKGWSPFCELFLSLSAGLLVKLAPFALLPLAGGVVGTEGSENFGSLSSSSREGNARLNPLMSSLSRGAGFRDDSDDGGEGGPRLDGGTNMRLGPELEEEVEGFMEGGEGSEIIERDG